MNKISSNLFCLTILGIFLWPTAIHAQSSNAPTASLQAEFHCDPIAEEKERVKRFHDYLLDQQKLSPHWYTASGKILSRQKSPKLIRSPGIDDEGWERLQLTRELLLQVNQPIEFYARVVDQNKKPVVDARLELHLTGVDTDKVFAKFPHMDMGEEQTNWTNIVFSDADGWVRLKGIAGHYLHVWSISKEGYMSRFQEGNNAEITYETNSVVQVGYVNASGELTMDAVNPEKGYTFHLLKK